MITFIQTGGTIDKDYPKTVKGYAFEIAEPAFVRVLEKLNPSFDYEVVELLKKDSQEITPEDRELLYATCDKQEHQMIVITHGTDTMVKTAEYLAKENIEGKTIIITGAMIPYAFGTSSDGFFNLGAAVAFSQCLDAGVYICMNGRYFTWDNVKKNRQTGYFEELTD